MKAGVVHAPYDIRYEDIASPVVKPGEVLVKVKYTGICGSDLPRVNGEACHYYPNVLGHEFSGTIVELGEGVTSRQTGQRVAGIPLLPCGKCGDCQRGDFSLCKHYDFIGSRRFGSFAEYVALPAENVVPFGDEVSFEQGAFFEPATVALHGLRRLPYTGGKRVAVLGGGTIGLFVMQWARIFGAREVVVMDVLPERLELAKRLGASAVIHSGEPDHLERAMAITGGQGFDYVFENAGVQATMNLAFRLAGNKSHVCLIANPAKPLTFSVEDWECLYRKEFFLTGSWMSYSAPFPGAEWESVAHYFQTGDLRFEDSLIFQKIPLSRIADAFALYRTPGAVKGKILIDSEY